MGVNGTVAAIGYGLGMLLGGYLVKTFGWSAIFWFNLPFGIVAVLLSAVILVEEKISEFSGPQTSFDYLGCLLFAIFIGSLMLCLSSKISQFERISFIVFSVVGFGFFVLRENKAATPLLDLALFKIHSFSIGACLRLLITIIYSSSLFFIPIYTQDYLHLNALESGITMVPLSIALFFAGPIGGMLSDKLGSRWIIAAGFLACSSAVVILNLLDGDVGYKIHVGMFLMGVGMGFFVPSNNSTTLRAIPPLHIGFVSGFLWSMAYIGTAVGTDFSALLLATEKNRMLDNPIAIVIGQSTTFHLLIPCALLGVVLCWLRPAKRA